MIDLQISRDKIDKIDNEIVRLFEERMKVCEAVAEYKIETGKQVLDVVREHNKIKTLRGKAHGEFNELGTQELFEQIMAISRKRQYQLLTEHGIRQEASFDKISELEKENAHVVYQGVPGAYSYAAMRKFFGKNVESHNVKTWRQALEDVAHKNADYAVLPIENSTAGIVSEMYDLLTEYNLFIVGEEVLRVDHVLLGMPDADIDGIKEVYSHPQGLAQCRGFLEQHLDWNTNEVVNTAIAAKNVREDNDRTHAAIASRDAGELYELKILAEDICNNKWNFTRFIVVGKQPVFEEKSDKISICFELPHERGTLYNMLSHIIYNGLNMTKIESRPMPGRPWEYRFFVDFNGNLSDSAVINALRGLEAETNKLQIFGNYISKE
ncbi:MAG: prephenate dehydratase [Eubacteriales bacterium]|nr:prephenate dehydratase [Eubacteriales bacterium]